MIESRYAVTRRNRTIHKRMRDYLYTLNHTPGLNTVILPVGDGVAVTIVEDPEIAAAKLAESDAAAQ